MVRFEANNAIGAELRLIILCQEAVVLIQKQLGLCRLALWSGQGVLWVDRQTTWSNPFRRLKLADTWPDNEISDHIREIEFDQR